MKPSFRPFLVALFFSFTAIAPVCAQEAPQTDPGDAGGSASAYDDSAVFARQGDVVLTQGELDAAIERIPPEIRLPYIRNGERMNQLVGSLLQTKVIAADAKAADYDKQEVVQAWMREAAEKELATEWIQHVVESAPPADYDALAHEYYLANPDKFQSKESVDVSHILIRNENRSDEEALELANRLVAELREDPTRFDDMVNEYSEDPSKQANGGRFPNTTRGEMVKPFEDKAFSMEEVGGISDPVKTSYGYHIIRLNAKHPAELQPFEMVKKRTEELARKKYLADYRKRYVGKLLENPIEVKEGAVEAMVKRYFGENLERAPKFED
ncbi:MAG: peptidyl-prolyl cis-trans isomerase [Lysobacterales bacterium]